MTYDQIRYIKRALAVVLVCFGSLVAYELHRAMDKRNPRSDTPLPAEQDDPLARGVEMTRLDSAGRREFVLRAAESIGRDEESQTFRDVEIEFEAGKERVPLVITADLCRFNHQTSAAHLEGNVVVRDKGSLRVETSTLDFHRQPDRVWTDEPVRFHRDDLEGEAGSLYYDVPAATWSLSDTVNVRLFRQDGPPVDIHGKRATLERSRSLVQFIDDVVVSQQNRQLRCNDLQIYLTEDQSAIEHVEAYENVELFMHTPSSQDAPVEEPRAKDASPRLSVLEEPGTKRLLTNKLEVLYREGTETLERMRALDGGRLVFETPARGASPGTEREIEGNLLAFEFDTEGRLTALRGRGGVTMTMRREGRPEEDTEQVTSRQLEADFDPETGELTQARCVQSVEFSSGDRRAEAGLGIYDAPEGKLTLTESPKLWDLRSELEARTVEIDAETGDLEARDQVRSTSRSDSENDALGIFPTPGDTPTYFVADHLVYRQKDDVAVYTGSARVFQGENRIEGDRIELRQKQGEIEAEGSVRTVLRQTGPDTDSPRLTVTRALGFTYRAEERVLRYRRDVSMSTDDMTLKGREVDVTLESDRDEVQEIDARGEVEIVAPNGNAHGDHAKYLPKQEEVRVAGEVARLEDGDKLTEGKELTFFLSDDRIFVDGREISRTKTIYASKPRPF